MVRRERSHRAGIGDATAAAVANFATLPQHGREPMRATRTRSLVLHLLTGVAALVTILGSDPHAQSQASGGGRGVPASGNDGWIQLFNGRNLDGWYTFFSKSGKNNDPSGLV